MFYGVVGSDVGSSLSPLLHAAAYREEGLPCLLAPVNVADEDELDLLFRPQGSTLFDRAGLTAGGWAVTSPYKGAALRSADVLAPRARRAGASNTLILKPGRVIAENTDADGVVGSLTGHGIDPGERVVLVQGTGGAARGAAVGLDLAGAAVTLRGRDARRTREVAEQIGVAWCAPDESPDNTKLLVNATPLGSRPDDPTPFSSGELDAAIAVVDMVYTDRTTTLAELAYAAGKTLIDGREMLAYQGFAQFAAFTGRIPPKEAMLAAVGVKKAISR
jgi:shikimate dehydrogenase